MSILTLKIPPAELRVVGSCSELRRGSSTGSKMGCRDSEGVDFPKMNINNNTNIIIQFLLYAVLRSMKIDVK